MNNLRNKVQLIGHLGQTPTIKEFEKGKKASFSLATSETYYNRAGERIKNTQWHQLECWNKTAEIVDNYLDKGSEIAIEGRITYDHWEDKEGNKRTSTKIIVNELMMLGKK